VSLRSQNIAIFPGPAPDPNFIQFPPFTITPSSLPTYNMSFGAPPPFDAIPLLVDGNIGTNHSFAGTFGTVGGTARWNAIGDRVPLGFLPYISTTGLRSTWENWGMNVGMSQTYSGTARDALISWQDATASSPTLAQNRLVFGVRDSTTTNFQELGQFRSNGTFGIGFNDLVISSTFTFDQKLELYDFSSNTLFQRWRTITSSPTGGARIGIDNTNQFQIRNEESANIEFWTNNNPQVYINEQPGATPFLGVGTNVPLFPPVGFTSDPSTPGLGGTGWLAGAPAAIPLLSVNGDISTNGVSGVYTGNVYIVSDKRLKQNITKLPEWKRIFEIQPYTYKYKEQEHEGYSYGFLAQDVYKTLPELTSGWGEALAVNYIGFIPFLSQGLQEHEQRLNAIEDTKQAILEAEKEISRLQAEIETLENQNVQLVQKFEELESENKTLKNQNQQLENRLTALEEKFNSICNMPCLQNNQTPKVNGDGTGNGFEQTGTLSEPPILEQNEPNPFTETTIIRYFLPEASTNSKIEVKNAEGKVVGSFSISQTGHGNISLASGTLAAGSYYYSLVINNNIVDTKKMVLLN
jgi:FtsZ-binding cell division protein ZapB